MDLLRELLDLAVRWTHVIAGIMWIGNSLLFNWLDRNLQPREQPHAGSRGMAWLLHSGGFYEVEKTLAPGATLPRPLHWFKWQAYTTWLTGAALLVVVYWMNGAALMMGGGTALSSTSARLVSAAALVGGFVVYELLWKTRRPGSATRAATSLVLILALAAALASVFNGRATFLHVGAVLGTIMAANVFFHIMPAQRGMVDAIAHGRPADPQQSDRAKLRSIHNNYMTFPVIALMLGSHFPGLYSSARAIPVLAVLLIGGAAVRHILNIRFGWAPWVPALAATIVATLATIWLLAARPVTGADRSAAASLAPVTLEQATAVVRKRCAVCHSTAPADRSFGIAPGGVAFDTPEQIEALAPRIRVRAVETLTMPPNNRTWMTDAERDLLGRWVRQPTR
jgi:uncharacterized membrane protein